MKLKTFQGRTMAEALRQVKSYFGRDAVILNTRTFTKGGVLGIGGKPHVEITAAREMGDLPLSLKRPAQPGGTNGSREGAINGSRNGIGGGGRDGWRTGANNGLGSRATSPLGSETQMGADIVSQPRSGNEDVLAELDTLKGLVADLIRDHKRTENLDVPDDLFDTYQKLIERQVQEDLAKQIVASIHESLDPQERQSSSAVRAALAKVIEQMLPSSDMPAADPVGGPTVIALVGPTGVGKTTTVAKLAATFCLRQMKSVGLITIDTYRIAAVEQLKTYAQIIDVPLDIVMSPDQLPAAIERMSDRDVILIDTAGRSQRDSIKIKELKCFFQAYRPTEVHLVLSGTCGEGVLSQAIDCFSEVGIDRVIFTKLDESVGFGVILGCLEKANAQLSYLTTGQDVPDDIEPAEGRVLAEMILDGA